MNKKLLSFVTTLSFLTASPVVYGGAIKSRCDVFPKGEDRPTLVANCTHIESRNGRIDIEFENGKKYPLQPTGANSFADDQGGNVRKEMSAGAIIYRFPAQSIFVYLNERAPASKAVVPKRGSVQSQPEFGSTPASLNDLIGAKAGPAEGQFGQRGFVYKNTQTVGTVKVIHYIQSNTGFCVEVANSEGRISAITYTGNDKCAAPVPKR